MDAETKIHHRFSTGHIQKITALEELGGNTSHPKDDLESTGVDIF